MSFDYDLLIMGGGSAGLAASKRAAAYGARVAIAEQSAMGGTCVNRGCVPKKLMVYAADFPQLFQDAVGYGWQSVQPQFEWSKLMQAIRQELQHIQQSHQQALAKAGVEVLTGRATFVDPHTLAVGDRQVTADKILIAVGGRPTKPNFPGAEHALTSDEMFQLSRLPQQIAIIGGGYIGVEFASMLRNFGSEVTLVDNAEQVLSGFDSDLRNEVQAGLIHRGIKFCGNSTAKEITSEAAGLCLQLAGDCSESLTVDTVLCAVGRTPNTKNLGLEQVGITTDPKGAIAVNEYSRTHQPNIFAVGDCTNRLALTPVAKMEAIAFVETEFGGQPQPVNYDCVPTAVFARPEAASVGLTETKAREQFGDAVRCESSRFPPLYVSLTGRPEKSLVKLVLDSRSDRVLGAHMVGEAAAEIIQTLAIAIRMGATKRDFDQAIGIHPSSAEEFLTL
ncbi:MULTISPECIES: glutathione-disulfide reductase [Trichocoleus]|uniref:Glutathione-disulfide reductase n=1 Tax=Trichocoleus desertorum GB2-A4 TaxID=2933944 RepID=A0ABV0J9A3_9CYAN|nr:glutathione-disulfide reductase [Trichocoleus sp. FACHB-46]MBD1864737.1 glutathione-disulfide reductase [Trichocoleus sp. FACHB-46]